MGEVKTGVAASSTMAAAKEDFILQACQEVFSDLVQDRDEFLEVGKEL